MSFLDEVDSLKAKLGIGTVNPFVLLGVAIVAFVAVIFIAVLVWGGFTEPGVVVERDSKTEAVQKQEQEQEALPATLCIHVAGEVGSPGMYELPQGARVSDAVNAAGGMTEAADQLSVNLARPVSDGEQIVVHSKVETSAQTSSLDAVQSVAPAASSQSPALQGKVNINTASASELTSLDGVGEATAAKIIAYRQTNGSFSSIEEIKNVSGIGDKKFEAIKDSITV